MANDHVHPTFQGILGAIAPKSVVHFAMTKKKLDQGDPMCGYVGTGELVSMDPVKCTCVECLDWIRPNHDWSKTVPQP